MANVNTKAKILVGDGFTCRYCGTRLYLAQAIKILDWHKPGKNLWDAHWKKEPLKSSGATVDHIIPEDEGGIDELSNLVACCISCNSSKGDGHGTLLPPFSDTSWDGLSGIFLAIAPLYEARLSSEDKKWIKALKLEGIMPSVNRSLDNLLGDH